MVIIKKRSMLYAFLMIMFAVFGYVFLNSGFNTKTRVRVDYEDSSDVYYKVNYIDDSFVNGLDNDRYISNMVGSIDINYIYNNLISEYVNGYYRYNVEGYLIAYEDDITNSLWERKYELVSDKTVLLDKNNVNNIKLDDTVRIDFKKYRDEIDSFIDDYDIEISGYLHIRINILEFLKFSSLSNEYADNKVIIVNIPLTDDIFKINVNNIVDKNSYYEFSSGVSMNLAFIIIGAICLSLAITFLVMVIRQFILIYNRQSEYRRELNKVLSRYEDVIVKVKRFYVNKKYNMIYVDSFDELMDVSEKKNKMISFNEVKKDSKSIFVIIDGDDAWIYRLCSLDRK